MAEKTKAEQLSETFRSVAGLDKRKNNKPISGGDSKPHELPSEPEGGYGGKDGISNTAAVNASEERSAAMAAERAEEDMKAAEQGEVEAPSKPAKKTAAKK